MDQTLLMQEVDVSHEPVDFIYGEDRAVYHVADKTDVAYCSAFFRPENQTRSPSPPEGKRICSRCYNSFLTLFMPTLNTVSNLVVSVLAEEGVILEKFQFFKFKHIRREGFFKIHHRKAAPGRKQGGACLEFRYKGEKRELNLRPMPAQFFYRKQWVSLDSSCWLYAVKTDEVLDYLKNAILELLGGELEVNRWANETFNLLFEA